MNVLSLFDGCSCARVALDRLGISCTYYASEIDKYAIKISKKNYPDIIHLGDVTEITREGLPSIDLLIGGSPCQDLSIAGKQKGLNGKRSGLFYEYLRLLEETTPEYFVLENVASMKKEWRDIISRELGVEPVLIDSALVSAQSRKRLYWTNFPVEQPGDKGILLKDILESGVVDREKSLCIDANYFKGTTPLHYANRHVRQVVFKNGEVLGEFFRVVKSSKRSGAKRVGYIGRNSLGYRVYSIEAKSPTITSNVAGGNRPTYVMFNDEEIRKLSPIECERLQTLPDNYTEGVSNTQRYKMLGNAFTVDVVVHILSFMYPLSFSC